MEEQRNAASVVGGPGQIVHITFNMNVPPDQPLICTFDSSGVSLAPATKKRKLDGTISEDQIQNPDQERNIRELEEKLAGVEQQRDADVQRLQVRLQKRDEDFAALQGQLNRADRKLRLAHKGLTQDGTKTQLTNAEQRVSEQLDEIIKIIVTSRDTKMFPLLAIEGVEQDLDDTKNRLTNVSHELEHERESVQRVSERLERTEDKLKHANNEIELTSRNLSQRDEKISEVSNKLKYACIHCVEDDDQGDVPAQETSIVQKFKRLREDIRRFVAKNINTAMIPDALRKTWTVGCMKNRYILKYFNSERRVKLLVEALIWHDLCKAVLGDPLSPWIGQGLNKWSTILQGDDPANATREQNRWRILTGQILRRHNHNTPKPVQLKDSLLKSLPWEFGPWEFITGEAEEKLLGLIHGVFEFGCGLASSKTRCEIVWKRANVWKATPFCGEWMEVIERSAHPGSKNIDALASPAIMKLCRPNGEPLDKPEYLVKAQVVYGADGAAARGPCQTQIKREESR
ncbi:hypothetical protein F5Y15DRAFT_425739 [Xylariaceae sp. FL0016]|nr:hypothetical protein F5Y15DRAFT_425739 [Xylariaceae sp. FL0016]